MSVKTQTITNSKDRIERLLDRIEQLKGKPVTPEHEAELEKNPLLEFTPKIDKFKYQFAAFVDDYTDGPA